MTVAVVFASGDRPPARVADDLPDERWVVAADGGADHARSVGVDVDIIVGDLDSLDRQRWDPDEVELVEHPTDKDASDLELALELVSSRSDVTRVIVVGGGGGRLDHLMVNAGVLCSDRWLDMDVEWLASPARLTVVRDHARIHGHPGQVVSLVPMGGPVGGVTTTGLRWPLDDECLPFGTSRGLSNEFVVAVATVGIDSGTLLVIQPDCTA